MLHALGSPPSFARVRSELEPRFRTFVRSDGPAAWLGRELQAFAHDPASQPGQQVGHPAGMFIEPEGRLGFLGVPEGGKTLTGEAAHRLLGLLTGHATVTHYRHHQAHLDPTVLDRQAALTPVETRTIAVGDILVLEAGRDVVDFEGHGLFLQAQTAPVWPVRWSYDRQTLHPVALVAANRTLGRIQDALDMLGHVGTAADVEICVRLARHPAHFIRWSAIQTAAILSPDVARRLLEEARLDPHPDVRASAVLALSGDRVS